MRFRRLTVPLFALMTVSKALAFDFAVDDVTHIINDRASVAKWAERAYLDHCFPSSEAQGRICMFHVGHGVEISALTPDGSARVGDVIIRAERDGSAETFSKIALALSTVCSPNLDSKERLTLFQTLMAVYVAKGGNPEPVSVAVGDVVYVAKADKSFGYTMRIEDTAIH